MKNWKTWITNRNKLTDIKYCEANITTRNILTSLHKYSSVFSLLTLFCITSSATQVVDDAGNTINLQVPAKRIITLAPYLTELVYTAGAGEKLIATVNFSDYPKSALNLPMVGDANGIDLESIVAMKPDLVLVWISGNGTTISRKLSRLGITLFHSEPQSIDDIGSTLLRLGTLAGTEKTAINNAKTFNISIKNIQRKYANLQKVPVFYQFWNKPIFTIGSPHLISRQIEFCGGENIFADQNTLTLNVDIESILERDPAVIIASGESNEPPPWLDHWNDWNTITAVKKGRLYSIPPELIQRHTVRIIQGMTLLCEHIDSARGIE